MYELYLNSDQSTIDNNTISASALGAYSRGAVKRLYDMNISAGGGSELTLSELDEIQADIETKIMYFG